MTTNAASAYGLDVACILDADALFASCEGVAVVQQDAIHRLTTDDVLGPGGDGWGYDVRRLLGAKSSELAQLGPVLAEVLTRDQRIQTADITLTSTTSDGFADVQLTCVCETDAGPFSFVKSVRELTLADWEAQAP